MRGFFCCGYALQSVGSLVSLTQNDKFFVILSVAKYPKPPYLVILRLFSRSVH